MIKNNYPLLLISDLIDSIEKKKVFTKMNLRWGYFVRYNSNLDNLDL